MLINWCDASLAVNRIIALYFPYHYKAWSSKWANLAMITGFWIISLSVSLPFPLRLDGAKMFLNPLGLCSVNLGHGNFAIASPAIVTFIPYAITLLGVLLILLKSFLLVRMRRRAISGQPDDSRMVQAVQRRLNRAKMLLLTFLWAALCAAPTFTIVVNFPFLYATNPVSTMWTRNRSGLSVRVHPGTSV